MLHRIAIRFLGLEISIVDGHRGDSLELPRVPLVVNTLGTGAGRRLVCTGEVQMGDHTRVAKGIALEGLQSWLMT